MTKLYTVYTGINTDFRGDRYFGLFLTVYQYNGIPLGTLNVVCPLPILYDEGEEVGHGGGPQPPQRVVVEAGVQRDNLQGNSSFFFFFFF